MKVKPIKKTSDFIFFWKPAGIPTTFGNQKSFLEIIDKSDLDKNLKEYGLLNRLDNDTSGLLYFSRNENIFETYKQKQKLGETIKTYYATVYGQISQSFFWIADSIGHHKDDEKKMTTNIDLIRGKQHFVKTYCEVISYDKKSNLTELKVEITKGVRHQIRCHLASFGHPISNDKVYCNKKFRKRFGLNLDNLDGNLGLISMGLKMAK